MIKLIVGSKGSGKTKTIIDMMNAAAEESNGHIVCIEKGMKSTYNIRSSVRIIDVDDYNIRGYDQFYGFFMGVLAGDYDILEVYLDGILKIGDGDMEGLGKLLDRFADVAPEHVRIIATVSSDEDELTESVKKYL
jgi:energy-coupling factor transporter ATP-binding protein EcfA2